VTQASAPHLPAAALLAAALLGAVLLGAPPPAAGSALALTPCRIEHPSAVVSFAAECGILRVPENPAEPDGRQVELHVARVPAVSRRKRPDPLFVLAGGPGMGASTFYATTAAAFGRIQRERDIVLVDQRGTGRSNALTCELDEDVLLRASDAIIAAEAQRCLDTLATRANVGMYTTSLAVQDLERVRAALRYERINLYGVSYGTRVAQHFVRRHPERTRAVILDGVVPPQAVLGMQLAEHAENALRNILARCAAEAACRERFGDPADAYQELRGQLDRAPERVSLPDPRSGETWTFDFTGTHLASVLRLASYTSDQAALLPLVLHRAWRDRDFHPLASQFLLSSRAYEGVLAYGMHNTVVCTEDVPFYVTSTLQRERMAATYLGTTQVDGLLNVCATWPRGPMDADLHEPLDSDVPALLLSGSDDPVTPPEFGIAALRGFRDALHLVLEGQGHGQLVAPCLNRVMADFIEAGSTATLDVSCTERVQPLPFFTSLAGPPP
jgi:pimeloyl-ACP methyl ester carboxylesterase